MNSWDQVKTKAQEKKMLNKLVKLAESLQRLAKKSKLIESIEIFPVRELDGYEHNCVERGSSYLLELVPPGVLKLTEHERWRDGWTEETMDRNTEKSVSPKHLRKFLKTLRVNPKNFEEVIKQIKAA